MCENKYRIITKQQYLEHMLSDFNKVMTISDENINKIKKSWEDLSKGYEFIILIGTSFCSVDYFNNILLCKENIDYKEYANELKKENENLLRELKVVKEDRDEVKILLQKYVKKEIEKTK